MKLPAILRTYKRLLFATITSNELIVNIFTSLFVLAIIASIIWFLGPYLAYADFAPLAQPDKRIYAIVACFLVWGLKFLLFDLDFYSIWLQSDTEVCAQSKLMMNRFRGVMKFMKNTPISKLGKTLPLKELPWFILIGPANAGKT